MDKRLLIGLGIIIIVCFIFNFKGGGDSKNTIINSANGEHGHSLLIKHIKYNKDNNGKSIIEIGSVREDLQGQNSTKYFIDLCKELNMKLISVDMDKECSDNALKLCKENNFTNYEIITAKGEDYLKSIDTFDYIYLDGYDYDHGKHSNERQIKYKNILGEKINNEESHNSHLDMVKTISNKGLQHSLICIDDVISDNIGKGVKAVPYLLQTNWKIVEKNPQSIIFNN